MCAGCICGVVSLCVCCEYMCLHLCGLSAYVVHVVYLCMYIVFENICACVYVYIYVCVCVVWGCRDTSELLIISTEPSPARRVEDRHPKTGCFEDIKVGPSGYCHT